MKHFILVLISFISINCFGYTISQNGKESIKRYETLQLTAYWDSNGYSIGYGHHGSDVKKNMKISKAKANALFNEDIESVGNAVNRLINALPIKHKFTQGFVDGMYDLVYNCGEGGVKNSEFYNRLIRCRKNNQNDLNFAIAAVKNMRISAPGHKKRRYEVHKMMLS